jgi:hypothetical protein
LRTTATAAAATAIAGLLRLGLTFAGGSRLVRRDRLILIILVTIIIIFVFASLAVEVQLDAMVEVSLLEHFAQVAGAHLRGQSLFFVVFQVVFFGLAMMMGSIKLFFFNELFFNQAAAGGIG